MNYKSLGIALVMAVGLFCYGYFLSTAGHDHSAHEGKTEHGEAVAVNSHNDGHDDHDHGDSHH